MLMHSGIYAWLQCKNNKKMAHSKATIDMSSNTISAVITLNKNLVRCVTVAG